MREGERVKERERTCVNERLRERTIQLLHEQQCSKSCAFCNV